MQAHLAHRERQQRMRMAAAPQPAIAPPAPPPPDGPQHDAHVWSLRVHRACEYAADFPIKIRCANIQAVVAGEYGVTITEMISAQRFKHIILPRHIAIYLSGRLTGLTLIQLGSRFGDRDHTTIINARRKMATQIELDPDFKAKVRELEAKCLEVTQHLFDLAQA